ncbi:MAG: hypothetical protein GQ537_03865, partial [Gammaproteobacteria bacterium]|nr:hypothetical protein [Gammaproteobacteria bacterium]
MEQAKRRILIVGGVAGGASAAARARRLCERCEIIVLGEDDVELIDVRSPAEFERGHIPGAKNIPLETLRGRLSELSDSKET